MAFTDDQKLSIRFYLGYPPNIYLYANTRLESAIERTGTSATMVARVQAILDKIATTEENLLSAQDTAGLKRAEEIEWYGDSNQNVVSILRKEGTKYLVQLSVIFGVPFVNNVFSSTAYAGDGWSTSQNQMSNGFGFNIAFK